MRVGLNILKKALLRYCKNVGCILFDVAVICMLASLFSFVFDFSWADPTNLFRESNDDCFSSKTFYQIKNNGVNGDSVDVFVLADIEDLTSREKIANFIDSIYRFKPKKIAIDLIFPTPQDSVSDMALVQTVRKIKDRAVFACMLTNYQQQDSSFHSIDHSFFLNPKYENFYCDTVKEGFVNMLNDGSNTTIWKYTLVEKYKDKNMFSLPAAILFDKIDEAPHTEHIINYDKIRFGRVTPYSLTRERIEGNYVIVGAYKYSGDKFDTPFGLIPGMQIHAYICQSENSDEITEQSDSDKILMTIVCLFLFVTLMVVLDCIIEFLPFKSISIFLKGGIMSLGLSFMVVYVLMRYSYYLFVEDLVFTNGRAALNGILVMTSFVKIVHVSLICFFIKHGMFSCVTRISIYRLFKNY